MAIDPNYGKGMWIDKLINTALANAPAPVGGSKPTKQVITGAQDGVNKTFTLPSSPAANTLLFFWNGEELVEGVGYTIVGNTITMATAPAADDTLAAYY